MDLNALRARPKNTVDLVAFREACRQFAEAEIAPRWKDADRDSKFPRELYHAACKAGLIGILAPEEIGGSALGVTAEVISIEEQGKINPNLGVVMSISQGIAQALLWEHGNPGHHDIARANIAGECLLALAVSEPEAGSDVAGVKTAARRNGDEWTLDGIKCFITLGGDCDKLVVLAQTEPARKRHGLQFFTVDRHAPGVTTVKMNTWANRPVPTYKVMFDNVKVPESARLDAGFAEIMAGFNRERILVCARWLGHMQTTLAWALEYAKTRRQFGKPIGANQSIAFQLAQAQVDLEATRLFTREVAQLWDSGAPIKDIILTVSSAKLFATQAVYRVTQTALHIGGGWGITDELPIMRMALDALAAPVTVGSFEIQLRAIAKQLGLPCD